MTIKDDGVGFDMNNMKRGFGLLTMHERIHSVHGQLNIQSELNKGTIIHCWFPCLINEKAVSRVKA